jgi:dinuclear metal center YbgI/SA1388 family protein
MQIKEIIAFLESKAPLQLQEHYDNCGLLTGSPNHVCTGVLVCLDVTENVILEAQNKGCNLIVAHHPLIFEGLKKITTNSETGRILIAAIKNEIAIYAIHTNLDNLVTGVNNYMARKIGLQHLSALTSPKGLLRKLITFVPSGHLQQVQKALFDSGAGNIGRYSECSFVSAGTGSFKPENGATPFSGTIGTRSEEPEEKLEVIFPHWLESGVIQALKKTHPYEEVAYDTITLDNDYQDVGSGLLGKLQQPLGEEVFLSHVKEQFNLKVIRHSPFLKKPIETVAICGGSGSFLIRHALAQKADAFITSDVKYHSFFETENRLLIADIGHWESEQFTIDLLFDWLTQKFPTFAVLKTEVVTNPVRYFL